MPTFYKIIAQTVLLYGAESWVMSTHAQIKVNYLLYSFTVALYLEGGNRYGLKVHIIGGIALAGYQH